MNSRRYKPRLRSLTKRWKRINVREPQESDWPFFWAAYKDGVIKELDEGMELAEFKEAFVAFVGSHPDFYVCACDIPDRGFVPVGCILSRNGGEHPSLHAFWFKWAKPRQIIEAAVKFLCLLRDGHTMGFVQHDTRNTEYDDFFKYLSEAGLLRRVGRIMHLYGKGHGAVLYQMTRKF